MPIQEWIQTDSLNEPEHQWIVMTYLVVLLTHVLVGRQPNISWKCNWNINFLVEIIS